MTEAQWPYSTLGVVRVFVHCFGSLVTSGEALWRRSLLEILVRREVCAAVPSFQMTGVAPERMRGRIDGTMYLLGPPEVRSQCS